MWTTKQKLSRTGFTRNIWLSKGHETKYKWGACIIVPLCGLEKILNLNLCIKFLFFKIIKDVCCTITTLEKAQFKEINKAPKLP